MKRRFELVYRPARIDGPYFATDNNAGKVKGFSRKPLALRQIKEWRADARDAQITALVP